MRTQSPKFPDVPRWRGLRKLAAWTAVALAALLAPPTLSAASTATTATTTLEACSAPDGNGIVHCQAGLTTGTVARIQASQQRSQWCWAASVAMILSFHGQSVAQEQIVIDRYGQPFDLPATSTSDVTQALERGSDGTGSSPLKVTLLTLQKTASLHINNLLVLDEMLAHRPLLIVRASHAMVLVQVRYERFPNGAVRVVSGTVIDPAPDSGVRTLARNELGLAWLIAVERNAPDAPLARTLLADKGRS